MAAYIDINPVRAGIVKDPEDYRWSGYGEAVAGKMPARAGLTRLMVMAGAAKSWGEATPGYRRLIFATGVETDSRVFNRQHPGGRTEPACPPEITHISPNLFPERLSPPLMKR